MKDLKTLFNEFVESGFLLTEKRFYCSMWPGGTITIMTYVLSTACRQGSPKFSSQGEALDWIKPAFGRHFWRDLDV